jgi:hypothetical protein
VVRHQATAQPARRLAQAALRRSRLGTASGTHQHTGRWGHQ